MYLKFNSGLLLALTSSGVGISLRQLWEFSGDIWIENIAVRPNGHLLLTTFDLGRLYDFDPQTPNSEPHVAAQLPGASALTGITELAPDLFAVTGGQLNTTTVQFAPGSLKLYTVDFRNSSANDTPIVRTVANVMNTIMLNGMLSLPAFPHIILSADSIGGRIFRVDTTTGGIDVVLQDPLLGLSNQTGLAPLGINGIKLRDNYLFFTNSAQRTFGRLPVSPRGDVLGAVEILTNISSSAEAGVAYDDFAFDSSGIAFAALHPNSLVKIEPSGKETIVAGGGNSTLLQSPTSVALSTDSTKLYVVTGGAMDGGLSDGGQVIEAIL
ncbi:hypothetical protein N431DRAFT_428136 [Stipitochalara longipes BDJ]|nr:hypothetical protein N431DRAFT_428136 [Stipitochalara longipes BDJ]